MLTRAVNRFVLLTFVWMNKKIKWILLLMCTSMLLLCGLQLYWNYQNYKVTVRNFKTDVNAALKDAIEQEKDARVNEMSIKLKRWMADSTMINVSIHYLKAYDQSVFSIADVESRPGKHKRFDIGFKEFEHQKIDRITPELKKYFINRYVEKTLAKAIRSGYFYWDTQTLGDSTDQAFSANKLDLNRLTNFYRKELNKRAVTVAFKLHVNDKKLSGRFVTLNYNAALREPEEQIAASFPAPNVYFLTEMKWLILISFLLIAITLFCFGYTAKTLLSQQQLNVLKDDFINNMTHEIKTPLSSMAITAEALQKFDNDEIKRKEYLQIISHQIGKLDELTDHLLNSSKQMEKGKDIFENLILNELINEAIANLGAQIRSAGAIINFNPSATELQLKGNRFDLVHALMNMIDNSIKYTVENPIIDIEVSTQKDKILIKIMDNGIGIDQVFKGQVFDKFFRVPTGNIHNIKGSGLGLSYVKAVIEQHHGKIYLQNSSSLGTTFTLSLPQL